MSTRLEEKIDKAIENQTSMMLTLERHGGMLDHQAEEQEQQTTRTDALETKVTKVFAFALISAGFVAAKYGTEILKIVGVIL